MNYTTVYDVAVLLFRLYVGYYFIPQGWRKIINGREEWLWLGQQMGNFGIHFMPIFWGLCATAAEFLGGFSLLFGFLARFASPFMAFTMLVAATMHIKNRDPWDWYAWPISYMVGFIIVMIWGAGTYSVDYWLWNR
jgi:putative oxidoreductase